MERLVAEQFRVPRPLMARTGSYVVGGWVASEFLPGATGPVGRWLKLLIAGRSFHEALANVPPPPFLFMRDHRWAIADRIAWSEAEIDRSYIARIEAPLRCLLELRAPVTSRNQVVHGDLTRNVVFQDGVLPAIIDFTPYWRPAAYSNAIVAADGLLHFNANVGLITTAKVGEEFPQLLLRAMIFRLATIYERRQRTGVAPREESCRIIRAVDMVANVILRN
jgi:uncharacterized protein (TIGR02569 family)